MWVGTCHQKRSSFQSLFATGVDFGKKLKYTCLERGPCLSGKGAAQLPTFAWNLSLAEPLSRQIALQGSLIIANFVLGLTELKRCEQFDIL